MIIGSILAVIYRIIGDRKGLALTEFAFVAPFLILLFVGGYQLTDAVSAYRKLTLTTRTVADLTSQYATVDNNDLTTILNASQQVLAPYDAANSSLTVSQVKINKKGVARVTWSAARNSTAHAAKTKIDLPEEIRVAGTSLIVAQSSYRYDPVIASQIFGSLTLTDQIVMSPRVSGEVEYKQ